MSTRSAARREVVNLQEKNLVDNGRGGRKRPDGEPEWIDAATGLHAEIIPLRGNEALANAVLRNMQLYRVTLHARADVTTEHRLMWRTTALSIKAAALSPDGRDLVLTCESGVPS